MPISIFRDDIEAGRLSVYALEDLALFRVLALARLRGRKTRPATEQVAAILRQETDILVQKGVFSIRRVVGSSLPARTRNSKRNPAARS